jgi:Flp pilus assembly protein TadG
MHSSSPAAHQRERPTRRSRGTALVESSITLLLSFMLFLGIMEAGRFLNVQQTVTNAARAGARTAVAPISRTSTLASNGDITSAVESVLKSANISGDTVTVDRPVVITTNGIPNEFTHVTVSVPYNVITLSMFSMLKVNLKGEALMRNETSP